jgi:endoglucanase
MARLAGFVADQGDAAPATLSFKVHYDAGSALGLLGGAVTIKNTGTTAIDGWNLTFAFIGNQKALVGVGAKVSQTGATVTATATTKIKPGQTAAFAFVGATSGPLVNPALFRLNGTVCS